MGYTPFKMRGPSLYRSPAKHPAHIDHHAGAKERIKEAGKIVGKGKGKHKVGTSAMMSAEMLSGKKAQKKDDKPEPKPSPPVEEPKETTDYSGGEWEIKDKDGKYRPAMLNIDGSFLRWKEDDEIAIDKEEEAKFDEELAKDE